MNTQLPKETNIKDLHSQANKLFPQLIINSLNDFEKTKKFSGQVQDEKNAAYWHQRNDDDGYINFKKFYDNKINSTPLKFSSSLINSLDKSSILSF